jgi:hypothetical protein
LGTPVLVVNAGDSQLRGPGFYSELNESKASYYIEKKINKDSHTKIALNELIVEVQNDFNILTCMRYLG